MKQPAVYILTNKKNGTLYIGVTSNLIQRVYQHKQGKVEGFTKKYGCTKLIFYEFFATMPDAIALEKKMKKKGRKSKIAFIENKNDEWKDLYESF